MDKDTDFTFMKSGFDQTGTNTVIDPDFRENMVAMITLFGENALRTSALYTKHSKFPYMVYLIIFDFQYVRLVHQYLGF